MKLLCSPLCRLRIKDTFPFPLDSVSVSFTRLQWAERTKTLAATEACSLNPWTTREDPRYSLLLSHFSCVRLCATPETRLPRPWDSPGKNTGVGCHFLLQCMKVKSESEVAQSVRLFTTPWTVAHQAPPSFGFSRPEYWSGLLLPSPKYHNKCA